MGRENVSARRRGLRWVLGSDSFAALLLFFVAALVYRPLIHLPPVQDDWGIFQLFWDDGVFNGVLSSFIPQSGAFYRPLPWPLFGIQFLFFGDDLTFFHWGLVLLHAASGYLGYLILSQLTGSRVVALCSAMVTVAASSIHLEPLSWMVGIYDVGGVFLALLSLILFLRGYDWSSRLAFLAAVLTKEATLSFPLVFAALALVARDGSNPLRRARWHFLIAGAIIAGKILPAMWGLPSGSPYALHISPSALGTSLIRLLSWGFEGIIPIPPGASVVWVAVPLGLLLISSAFLLGALRRQSGRGRAVHARLLLFLTLWTFAALLPVLPLSTHLFRYYVSIALMPVAALAVLGLREWAHLLRRVPGAGLLLLGSLAAASVVVGARHVQTAIDAGIHQIPLPGENRIPGKGAEILLVRKSLLDAHPQLPRGSRIVFEGVETRTFGGATGPRFWYRDPAITVESRADLYESLRRSPATVGGEEAHSSRPVFLFVMEMEGTQATGRLLEQPVDFPSELP